MIAFEDHFQWCVSWFDKESGRLVGEEDFSGLSLLSAKQLFGETQDYITDVYDIHEEHRLALQSFIQHVIDLNKYDYQFEPTAKG